VSYLNSVNKLDKAQGFVLINHISNNEVRFKVNGQSTYGPAAQYYEKIWNAPTYTPENYCSNSNPSISRIPLQYVSGDFDGDGLSDVIALEQNYTTTECMEYPSASDPTCPNKVVRNGVSYCCFECTTRTPVSTRVHFIKLDRRIATNFVTNAGYLSSKLQSSDRIYTADVNGDGRTDILQIREGILYAYSLNSATNLIQLLWETTDSRIKAAYPILQGDYNGDGKTDFYDPKGEQQYHICPFPF
jgi:hypothetical protein